MPNKLTLVLSASPLCAVAQNSQKVSHEILAQNKNISDSLLKQLLVENTVFNKSGKEWKPKSGKSISVQIHKINNVKYQAAVYSHICVVTALNGPERMNQMIFTRIHSETPKPVCSSSDYKHKGKKVIHKYRWGTVVTYKSGKQEIKAK